MDLPPPVPRRLRAWFGRRQWEEDMAEEMRLHLEQRTEENIAAGLTPEEAHYAARRQFGGLEQIKEAARDQRASAWAENVAQDLRFGARMLRKQPGFTLVAVLTLALGIGATTAIFSVVDGVLLRPLAYPRPGELMLLGEISPKIPQGGVAPATFLAWSRQAKSFAQLAAWTYGPYNLTGGGEPRRVFAQRVTAGYFGTLGVLPALGRNFHPEDETPGQDNVVILSQTLWQDRFGGRAAVVGQTILLDERPCRIIGVMPADFQFDRRADLYTPCVFTPADRENHADRRLLVLGRLRPGVTSGEAREEMNAIAGKLAEKFPATNKGWGVLLLPLLDAYVQGVRPLLYVLLGAVGFLLLIACMNIAHLLLARASTRQREIAVRVALGAGRGRIVRQLLVESLLIAALGGTLGLVFGYGGLHLLLAFAPEGLPRMEEVAMNGHVLAFAFALSCCTGLAFGLAPALESTGGNAFATLKDGGHGLSDNRKRRRLRSTLVVLEVALALVLLTGAGLLTRSFLRLLQVDTGFQTRNLYMSNLVLIAPKYPSDAARTALVDDVISRLNRVPGIQVASLTNHTLPMMGMGRTFFTIDGRALGPMELPPAFFYAVTPGYFKALGIPLRRGRSFTAQDVAGAPRVVLINQEMVRQHFPDTDPIGQRLSVGSGPEDWREIVGVVGDVRQGGPGQIMRTQIYAPYAQHPDASTTVVVRTTLPPEEVAGKVAAVIHAIDPDIPFKAMYPLADSASRGVAAFRFVTFLFGVFAVTALFLAVIGVYGVMTYAVSHRTAEIGLRMALGAQRRDVLWLVLRQGGRMVGAGLIFGLAGSFAITRTMAWMLFEVSPYDPLTLAVIVTLLAAAAFLACWLPARKATQVDPLVALRCE